MRIYEKITDLIGSTPLLRLSRYAEYGGLPVAPIAKLEYFNPAGSVKDRAALTMVEEAERMGLLTEGATIVEPTSGNTGIGLALVCTVKGFKLILTMPDTMSRERISLLEAYGAQVQLTDGSKGMRGAIARAEEIVAATPGAYMLRQFDNEANALTHYTTTAEEIWADTDGSVDIFVAGVGTGGTISGTARRLKELNPAVRVVAVEPADSAVLSGGVAAPHKLQGIGAGFIPSIYDASVVDEVVPIAYDDAVSAARALAGSEGVLVGFSSGAALAAASQLAGRVENRGKNIVVLLPDSGERYLSTELFENRKDE